MSRSTVAKKANPYYLFVYGTLRKEIPVPFKKKVEEDMEFVGRSQIQGKLYDIGDYPGAVKNNTGRDAMHRVSAKMHRVSAKSPAEGGVIKGEVVKINNPGKVMALLDEYEGYDRKKLKTSEYLREKAEVKLDDGKKVEVWIYWYNLPVEGKRRIRHRDYLDYLKTKKPTWKYGALQHEPHT